MSTGAPIRVLIVCTGNSIRSQMAEAFLERAGGNRLDVESAGTHPWIVHPLTIAALAEVGIDWSKARSQGVAEFLDSPFDVVVTVCDDANEICPVFPGGGRRVHRGFFDPVRVSGSEAERMAAFRRVRDEIDAWATGFAAELMAAAEPSPAPYPRLRAQGRDALADRHGRGRQRPPQDPDDRQRDDPDA